MTTTSRCSSGVNAMVVEWLGAAAVEGAVA
jgi:hypothetical protein